jgi:hypothetical protein
MLNEANDTEGRTVIPPDSPSMRCRDVDLSILVPKRRRVISLEFEMDGLRPRERIERILRLEENLHAAATAVSSAPPRST